MNYDRTQRIRRWLCKQEQRAIQSGCYRTFSRIFVPLSILVLIALPLGGRSLIWFVDGLSQYYTFFVYEGQWIRNVVGSLLGGGGFNVPLWEWCMGYGVDVPATFDVFLDPLNLTSAITPPFLSEWVFQLLFFVRLYLAGLGFIFYCQTRGEKKTGTVLGALLYALCGAALTGVRWSSGLHALVLFPVILAGAERILAGKKPWVFVATLSLLAIVSYYFTYMVLVLLVLYLALRVCMVERDRGNLSLKVFLAWTGRFAGLVVLCLLVAGFALVPAAFGLMGMDRLVDSATEVPLLYGVDYYRNFLLGFLSIHEVGSDTYQGFGGMAFFACMLLFVRRDKNRELRAVFVVLTVCLLLPCVGSFMNVMNYASNRWAWAYDLCVCLVLVRMTPTLLVCDGRTRRVLVGGTAVYALLLLFPPCRVETTVAGMAALLASLLGVTLWRGPDLRRSVLVGGLSLTLIVNGMYFLSPNEGGVASGQTPIGATYSMLTSRSIDQLSCEVDDSDWWRYDANQAPSTAGSPMVRIRNNSLILGKQAISFYNSVYNDGIDAFHTELGVVGDDINFSFADIQGRSDLLALLGVRYFLYRPDGTDALPYSFEATDVAAGREVAGFNYQVVRSDQALPLGVAYEHVLTRSEYLALSPVQRQQALLQAVVLADGADLRGGKGATTVRAGDLVFEDRELPFTIEGSAGVTVEDGRIVASVPKGVVTLKFEGVPEADTYLYVDGLDYESVPPSTYVSEEKKAGMPWFSKAKLLAGDFQFHPVLSYEVDATSDVSPLECRITNSVRSYHMYGGKSMWLGNLGYAQEAAHTITLRLTDAGIYTYDDLKVVAETHAHRDAWIRERMQNTLQNVVQGCNRLTGDIDLPGAQTLLLTVAYSKGWSAKVDGKPAELLRADTGFMALNLEAGHHEVELTYQTPGLFVGVCVTGVGLLALGVFAIVIRRTNKRARG